MNTTAPMTSASRAKKAPRASARSENPASSPLPRKSGTQV